MRATRKFLTVLKAKDAPEKALGQITQYYPSNEVAKVLNEQ
jgi:hypothetical protein